ncbi:MAG: hypothetical protein AAGE52_41890 [Myxococcota bacterium]
MTRALLAFCLAACGEEPRAPIDFALVDPSSVSALEANVSIDADAPTAAREAIIRHTLERDLNPTWIGIAPWETVAVGPATRPVDVRIDRGQTYLRQGTIRLQSRLGAGDRGAFMGGVAETGALRAMLEVQFEDREVLGARFLVRLHAVEGRPRPRDITPEYLQRAVPRGTYRAWIDIPEEGGRYLAEVKTLDREGNVVGRAWASPIEVRRPWR